MLKALLKAVFQRFSPQSSTHREGTGRKTTPLPEGEITAVLDTCLKYEKHGRPGAAAGLLKECLDRNPHVPEWQYHLGLFYLKNNDQQSALECFNKATSLNQELADAHYQAGVIHYHQGNLDEALVALEAATLHDPQHLPACLLTGDIYRDADLFAKAEEAYREALEADERDWRVWERLGYIARVQARPDDAIASYTKAMQLTGNIAPLQSAIGRIHRECGRYADAETWIRRALENDPDDIDIRINLAQLREDMGDTDQATREFDSIVNDNPGAAVARWYRSLHLLRSGKFEKGWDDYEARWQLRGRPGYADNIPAWNGTSVPDASVLVYGEQGMGDEIMFSSCIPDLITRVGSCFIACEPRLVPLFSRSFPEASVISSKRRILSGKREEDAGFLDQTGPVDMQVAMGSLPRWLRRDSRQFPRHTGYLKADPARVDHWRKQLSSLGNGLTIGISWRGGTRKSRTWLRSIPLTQWQPILALPGAHFVNLQYTDCRKELSEVKERFNIEIHHWQDAITDFDETAAMVTALDLVISVQTTLVHLAGALGQQAWVLLPTSPEWRYLHSGDSMPWYPSLRLYRQSEPLQWAGVIGQVQKELHRLMNANTG